MCTLMCVSVYMYMCMHVCLCNMCACVNLFVCALFMHVCVREYLCVVCMCVQVHVYMH